MRGRGLEVATVGQEGCLDGILKAPLVDWGDRSTQSEVISPVKALIAAAWFFGTHATKQADVRAHLPLRRFPEDASRQYR